MLNAGVRGGGNTEKVVQVFAVPLWGSPMGPGVPVQPGVTDRVARISSITTFGRLSAHKRELSVIHSERGERVCLKGSVFCGSAFFRCAFQFGMNNLWNEHQPEELIPGLPKRLSLGSASG